MEKEVVIWSTADLLGGKSHSDTDLRRTVHTNEIITDMVGGLLGKRKKKKGATPQLPQSPLPRPWLTCSRYMGIMDNRPPFMENVMCVLISGMIRFLVVRAPACNILSDNHRGISSESRHGSFDAKNWDVGICLQTLWGMTKDCEGCIELWMTPWYHSVPRWEGIRRGKKKAPAWHRL